MSPKSALVQAVYANGKMTVNIRRLGLGEQPAKTSVDVPLLQTVGTTYPAAAQAAVRAIEDMWKTRSAIDFSQRGQLTADVRIASLAQWGEIQTALGAVSNVTGVTVTAMDMDYARINLAYHGRHRPVARGLGGRGAVADQSRRAMDARPRRMKAAMIRHLPNLLSALRLLAAPLAAWLIVHGMTSPRCWCLPRPAPATGWTALSRGAGA